MHHAKGKGEIKKAELYFAIVLVDRRALQIMSNYVRQPFDME